MPRARFFRGLAALTLVLMTSLAAVSAREVLPAPADMPETTPAAVRDGMADDSLSATGSGLSAEASPASPEGSAKQESGGIATTLFHHVLNSRELELFPGIPPVELPFGMTVHLFMILLCTTLIIVLTLWGALRHGLKPTGLALAVEMTITFVRDDMIYPVMGEKRGAKWMPFFMSLFLFIFFMNVLGLIPAFKAATGNVSVTGALAILIFLLTFIVGFTRLGPIGFFKNIWPAGSPAPIAFFVMVLEFMGFFTKSLVLCLRLFANMFAGHLAILSFLVLIFILGPAMTAVSLPFAIFIYVLEVLVSLIQAFVFTLLSSIFISMASTSHDGDHAHA